MNNSPRRRSKLAIAGIASPIVLSAAVMLVALQRPEYSHVARRSVSSGPQVDGTRLAASELRRTAR